MSHLKKIINIVINRPDSILAFIGIFLSSLAILILVYFHYFHPVGLFVTILAISLGYLCLSNYSSSQENNADDAIQYDLEYHQHPHHLRIILISVFCIVIVALSVIFVSVDSLRRPLWVFFALAIMPGYVLGEELYMFRGRNSKTSLLFQLMIIGVAIVLSGTTVYPVNGGDTIYHLHNADLISQTHTMSAISGSYYDYPLYPASLAVISSITGLRTAEIARFYNIYVIIVSLLLIYSLSKELNFSNYQSLVLILLLLGSRWFIYWLMNLVSMTAGLILFFLVMVILFLHLFRKTGPSEIILLFFICGLIPFFHPLLALCIIILFLLYWGLSQFPFIKRTLTNKQSILALVIFTIVVTLTQWIFFGHLIFGNTVKNLVDIILLNKESSIGIAKSYRDSAVYTFDQLNFFFLLFLAGLEIFRQIRYKEEKINLSAGLVGIIFVVIGYSTQVINASEALPFRWLLFGTFFLIFPASFTFARLFRFGNRLGRIIAILVMILYFFGGLTNTEVNRDRPLYGESSTIITDLTSSENASLSFLHNIILNSDRTVMVDRTLWYDLEFYADDHVGYWESINLNDYDGIFPIRNIYFKRFISHAVGNSALSLDLNQPNLAEIYDSGDIKLFDRVNGLSK